MRIDPFAVPLVEPFDTARGRMTERRGFLVTVERDGEVGVGEATPLPGWTETYDDCAAALERAARAHAASAECETAALAACEGAPAARHAVSLAYADATARARGLPLYRSLGAGDPLCDVETDGSVETVPVNATVGDADAEATADRVGDAVADGFETVKLKVGARSLDADLARLDATREMVPDATLRVDANGAWDVATAERARSALPAIEYVEQPLAAPSLDAHAALRGRTAVALDESVAAAGLDAVLETEAADVVVLKPMALGGVEKAVEAGRRARAAGVEPVVTTTFDAVYARTAAVHVAAALAPLPACGLATGDALAADLAPDPAPVSGGGVAVPQGKGNGVPAPLGE
ncbi:O-succinylbenzoate synthase [Halarchaeum acidiphilum MH1-52-1]|uniref:o-succinylbenzoate synthase n=1 Tax=Halarchaeum acidiphilum MH1-52-1 TaxID=1261545 RepID=U2YX67_9EURY|nr:o-succinylbenzoate synthase [Halarchaeum acidiphilum]GAD53362.1 O-succinylbenzoate synthase [Halarchaeum acidiphilum MH1-52-1]